MLCWRKLVEMEKTIVIANSRIEVANLALADKEQSIRDLIRNKKKNEAKRQLQVFKTMQDEIIKQKNLLTLLEKTKIQVESAIMAKDLIKGLKDGINIQKSSMKQKMSLKISLLINKNRIKE